MKCLLPLLMTGALLMSFEALGRAQIERLTLEQMVERADHAVFGEVVARRAFRVDHPIDGPELYFTVLTVAGRSLVDGRDTTVDVLYNGGWVSETEGVWNSEAPREEETEVGRRVVVFYTWTDNMGGDVAGNAIHAMHGGLYRTAEGPRGAVVLGRGTGYAIPHNVALDELDTAITSLHAVGSR